MNDQFGGFDLGFSLESFAPRQVQQQPVQQIQHPQQHGYLNNNNNNNTTHGNNSQNNNNSIININNNNSSSIVANGPCMENYDPNQASNMMRGTNHSTYNNSMGGLGGHPVRNNINNNTNSNNTNSGSIIISGNTTNHNQHHRHHHHHQQHQQRSRQSQHNSNSHTHQILMPSEIGRHVSTTTSSSHQQTYQQRQPQQQQQPPPPPPQNPFQTGFPDFEPIPISKHGVNGGRGNAIQQQQFQPPSRSNSANSSSSMNQRQMQPQVPYQQQQQQQQQQQKQSYRMSGSSTGSNSSSTDDFATFLAMAVPSGQQQQQQRNNSYKQQPQQQQQQQRRSKPTSKPKKEEWLENLKIPVPGVSLEPMSGTDILKRLKERSSEVLTRYLPCVDFLVQCQQELRKGLQVATTQRYVHNIVRDTMTPREFHNQYIAQLPARFLQKNRRLMTNEHLGGAFNELKTLVSNAKRAEKQGCEAVKNTFLGGMKDGESWGLRKWLSKHGGALHICNDTECLSTSCQKLDRELESTRKLAERLRPLAAAALKKLKSDIPSSYQEQSSAHPYLPFFHRLECALRGMSNFDPEDDDVICIIDDDEVEELKAKAAAAASASSSPNTKRKRTRKSGNDSSSSSNNNNMETRNSTNNKFDESNNRIKSRSKKRKYQEQHVADDDDESWIEVLEQKPPAKRSSSRTKNTSAMDTSQTSRPSEITIEQDVGLVKNFALAEDTGEDSDLEQLLKTLDDNNDDGTIAFDDFPEDDENATGGVSGNIMKYNASQLADGLDSLASLFDTNQHDKVRPEEVQQQSFWDESYPYASALRLFSEILRSPESSGLFLESIDEDELVHQGNLPYSDIVKHPLCFRDICASLLQDFNRVDNSIACSDGILPCGTTLSDWNMWNGMHLLQAIDLVFLNSLAYGKANDASSKSNARSKTNKLRKVLWAGIKEVIDASLGINGSQEERRKCTPTKRGESSGFVVHKVGT